MLHAGCFLKFVVYLSFMKSSLFLSLLFLVCGSAFGQHLSKEVVEQKLPGTWVLDHYMIGEMSYPPKTGHEKDRVVYYADHTADSYSGDAMLKVVWTYDESTGVLTISEKEKNFLITMYVISIEEKEAVMQIEYPGGKNYRTFWKPLQ